MTGNNKLVKIFVAYAWFYGLANAQGVPPSGATATPLTMVINVNKWNGMRTVESCQNVSAPGNELFLTGAPRWDTKICRGGESDVCAFNFQITKQTNQQICAEVACNDKTKENCAGTVSFLMSETMTHEKTSHVQTTTLDFTYPAQSGLDICAHPENAGDEVRFKSWTMTPINSSPYSCTFGGGRYTSPQGMPCVHISAGGSSGATCKATGSISADVFPAAQK